MTTDPRDGAARSHGMGRDGVQLVDEALARLVAEWELMPEAVRLSQMMPGPALLAHIQTLDLDQAEEATLVEVAAAARRVEAAAHEAGVRAAAVLAERTTMNQPALAVETDGQASTAGDELAMRLHAPRNECLSLIRQGIMLTTTLSFTGVALRLGRLDPARAKIMVEALWDVPWQTAMAVEDLVLPKAPGRTPQQLRRDIAKALISVDPEDAEARAQRRARDRRVGRPRVLPDGAASLWVEGPAADVLALDVALDAAARAAKADGDARTLDQLRFDTLAGVGSVALAQGRFPGTDVPLAATVGGRRPEIQVVVALEHLVPPEVCGPAPDSDAARAPSGTAGTPAGPAGPTSAAPPGLSGPAPDAPPGPAAPPGSTVPGSAASAPPCSAGPPGTAVPGVVAPSGSAVPGSVAPGSPGSVPLGSAAPPARDPHALHPDPPTRSIDVDSVPELVGYGPITPVAARALIAGGILRRLVTDPLSGAVLDLGHSRYRPSQELADFIVARDRTCVGPGCSHPAGGCQLDHTIPWVDAPDGADQPGDPRGGRTSEDNLGPMCTRTHLIKTHGGFDVEQVEPGVFEWTTPAGLRYRRDRDEHVTFLGHVINGTLCPPLPPDAPPPF